MSAGWPWTPSRSCRRDEAFPGVKRASWVPPEDWGEPLTMPTTTEEGIPAEFLLFPGGRRVTRLTVPFRNSHSVDVQDDD